MRFRISAIICAYNEEKALPAAIHSLFTQTRLPDEVIVVNNASTDGTRAVAERIPDYDTVLLKRNGVTVEGTRKKNGKVVQTYQRVVSEDRKTMTVATTGRDASGQTLNSVAVFDRR